MKLTPPSKLLAVLCPVLLAAPGWGAWPGWRGPFQNGTAGGTGLVEAWTPGGPGQAWRAAFTGRSTPVVLDGRVFVMGRAGRGVTAQEQVAAFDATTGELLWEDRFNVFHTTIPFNRVGWASLAVDPQTGRLYAHGVQGLLRCYSRDGELLWEHSLTEEFGRISGYGGRVQTPVVAGGLVILNFLSSGWGAHGVPRDRYFAFDKHTGEVVWVSAPGGRPLDTTYSTPVVADIGGQRLVVAGNADGSVYAMRLATGEKVWGFRLSRRGLNAAVVVGGDRVYASHGEENVDGNTMGRVVCIDGRGQGDVTATHELWRYDALCGYASPALAGGVLYLIDNSGNLHALDAASGRRRWRHNLGTVGRGSPVVADGKLYATTVNGRFHILRPGEAGGELLDSDQVLAADGGPAEIFGSPAVAQGRVYFTTDDGLYCLGDGSRPEDPPQAPGPEAGPPGEAAGLRLVPAESVVEPGGSVRFEARLVDAMGRSAGAVEGGTWSTEGLAGTLREGVFTADPGPDHGGVVTLAAGGFTAGARVRVLTRGPWKLDFEAAGALEEDRAAPAHWIGSAGGRFLLRRVEGGNLLHKPLARRGLQRSNVYLGPADLSGYTIQASMMGATRRRNLPDMGLIAQRYTLDLMGNHQQLQVRSWASDLRMAASVPFSWESGVWYTMKMRVDLESEGAAVRGKVWRRKDPEPAGWTIEAPDPLPNRQGAPGLYGHSAAEIYYDDVTLEIDD